LKLADLKPKQNNQQKDPKPVFFTFMPSHKLWIGNYSQDKNV